MADHERTALLSDRGRSTSVDSQKEDLNKLCLFTQGSTSEEASKKVYSTLTAALVICFVFMIVEVVGGFIANSLAIMTDAAHLLSDVSGFAVALFAAYYSAQKSKSSHTFGYHRVEVLGALASVLSTWLVTGILVVEAVNRIFNPEDVNGKLMTGLALAGVAVNAFNYFILGQHGHSHGGHDHDHDHDHGHGHSHSHSHGTPAPARTQAAQGHDHGSSGHSHNLDHSSHGHDHDHASHGNSHDHGSHGDSHDHDHDHSQEHAHSHGNAEQGHSHGHDHGHSHADGQDKGQSSQHKGGANSSTHGHRHGDEEQGGCSGSHSHGDSHDHGNMNLRGALLHVIGDLVQSIGVAFAGILIWINQDDPRWRLADPLCTFLFAGLVLLTTFALIREIWDILMERVPRGKDIEAIHNKLLAVQGVTEVRDLHVWGLKPGVPLLAAHLVTRPSAHPQAVLEAATKVCQDEGISHSTLQIHGHDCDAPASAASPSIQRSP